ncbi:MAG: hypothetical protein UT53_C0006G0002 [Candidatus Yanofskybacteria bacterium GW2011_GWD2_39_48]|uniref:Uncharacterized protein n=1 Tax=Candidatus Yanofskybacteria bacterium GW2011_GWD2_39_48 TaxID=1619031 RepID=A0A0G0SDU0_9BACT|nr:MAG: hypothetical protein UT53_C0006G0002 [Candidatus Yanofskybacteria bacterium GW2011_GWD2_39_48]
MFYFINEGKLCHDLQKPLFLFKDMKYLEKPKIEWLDSLDYAYVTTKVGYSEPENLLWLPIVAFIRSIIPVFTEAT